MTEWDATTYDRIAEPQERWARSLLERLELRGAESVLDAGCGSGRVTELLLRRLPAGRVIALDRSPAMLARATQRLGVDAAAGRVRFVQADLGRPLPLDEQVDAIFSNATFHWVVDHAALFRHLAAVVRPGGQLVAQCGGAGNIASVGAVLKALGEPWPGPWTFATAQETATRLDVAGFVDVRTWLEEAPTSLAAGEPFETFLRTVVLTWHVERVAASRREAFVHAVAERLPGPVLDYVRLNIVARRSHASP